jgi:hypothetical protein
MGMFDYLKCEHPLPDGYTGPADWQTKDTDDQYLSLYTITADGRLVSDDWHMEEVPLAERPYPDAEPGSFQSICGIARRVVDRANVERPFHGDLFFYSATDGDFNDAAGYTWREYRARFTEGKLLRIDLIECERRMPPPKQQSAENCSEKP